MTSLHAAHDGTNFVCYTTDDGIRRQYVGCSHKTPRQVAMHRVPVYVSPLRQPSGDDLPVTAPPSGDARVGSSPKRRRRRRGGTR